MSEPSKLNLMQRLRGWVSQWQEFVVWLPVLFVIAIVAYVLLGAVVRIGADPLAWLAEIPVMCAWAAVACATAWLIKRTYWMDLDDVMERELYERVLNEADPEAWRLLIKDRVEWLALLLLAFAFFWPAR
ncbi:hypothetical protein PQS31_06210 [Luteimonas sp BLCC-B24]|uniref:hypothetical protein n=1 Tax=Luteimonas sp. BLCC-B24 TaxID=3025317 RepID=UPI00234C79F3|nr:hypothetical protein [Luteimonas sp. BLCC-B24]MDC7806417.1 hypothetical protein [Luteimonas sp. BLCC-B24]